jgi:hypothetical protein
VSSPRFGFFEAVRLFRAGKMPIGAIVEGTPEQLNIWRELYLPTLEGPQVMAPEGALMDEANPKDLLGVKKAPLGLVPRALRISAAPAMLLGARKYGPYNWREKAVRLSVYLEAIDRHLDAYNDRQDLDDESGASHLSHVAACLAIIADADAIGKLIDDRPVAGGAAKLLEEQNDCQRS